MTNERQHFLDILQFHNEISLPELADALNKQASFEARIGYALEDEKRKLDKLEQEFAFWVVKHISSELKARPTREQRYAQADSHGVLKEFILYESKILEQTHKVNEKEVEYRSAQTRGKLLQSLRNIIQGNEWPGLDESNPHITKKERYPAYGNES